MKLAKMILFVSLATAQQTGTDISKTTEKLKCRA